MNLKIIEGVHLDTGKALFEVIDDNGYDFKSYGIFRTFDQAEYYINHFRDVTEMVKGRNNGR
jgi:hypothetical protein